MCMYIFPPFLAFLGFEKSVEKKLYNDLFLMNWANERKNRLKNFEYTNRKIQTVFIMCIIILLLYTLSTDTFQYLFIF